MRSFEDYNPIVTAVYIGAVAGIAMFCQNPILLALSLLGALLYFELRREKSTRAAHLWSALLFLATVLINPLMSHNGVTVLFVLNDNPITAEAVVFGAVSATMLLAVLYWFRTFTRMMTSDKLLYLFGLLSPKLALTLSMAIRYVPMLGRQSRRIRRTQTAIGLYREDNVFDRVRGGMRVFSVLVTWALEGGIVTADSMEARGYGIGRRTHFSDFRFRRSDAGVLSVILLLSGVCIASMALGTLDVAFYPRIVWAEWSGIALTGYLSYAALALLPIALEMEERIRWSCLQSKI